MGALNELVGFLAILFVAFLVFSCGLAIFVGGFLLVFALPVILLLAPVFAFLFLKADKLWELTK